MKTRPTLFAIRAGIARHRNCVIGAGARFSAFGHRLGDWFAHRGVLGEHFRRHAQQLRFHLVRVNDEAPRK